MRHRIWLLALVVSLGLACAREKDTETNPTAAAATPTPSNYTLNVAFEGMVGFVNTSAGNVVWAMLPNADPNGPRPHGTRNSLAHYPPHYAVLEVNGKNVKGFDQPVLLRIPISGYDITTSVSAGTGASLTAAQFVQTPNASVDKIATSLLATTLSPADQRLLATRMKLPNKDLRPFQGSDRFFETRPQAPSSGICLESADDGSSAATVKATRVEWVTWSPSLTGDFELTLQPFDSGRPATKLILHPAPGESTVDIKILNKVAEAIANPVHNASHFASYRWFYNLSDSSVHVACNTHYYPKGTQGGNRCPQKLYSE